MRDAIQMVRSGGAPMSPQIARRVIEYFHPDRVRGAESGLKPKEREVIQGLVEGMSYKAIADHMNVGIDTVRSDIKNIYRKLHDHGKAAVISKSLKGEI